MNIHHPVAKGADYLSRDSLHIAGQDDEICPVLMEQIQHACGKRLFVGKLRLTQMNGRKSVGPSDLQNARARVVADDKTDTRVGDIAPLHRRQDRLKI
jgi:hypothetical protein